MALLLEQDITELLFPNLKGQIEIREIDTIGKPKSLFFTSLEEVKAYTPPQDKNVYIGMFNRSKFKGDKKHCLYTNVLWADYDNMKLEQAKENIFNNGLPYPSIFVNSGHGIHAYWVLDKSEREGIEDILKAIAEKTNADMKATEIARVMRLPGTMNVKKEIPKRCEVVEQNQNRYSLEMFQNIFEMDPKSTESEVIDELESSRMACIRLIAKGVSKGQRNFALGKITAFMKQQGISRKKSFDIAKRWNKNNIPVKSSRELQDEFNRFWDSDYKYLGCKFSNPDLERINKQLCPIGECEYHTQQRVVNGEGQLALDNIIFKDYEKTEALEIACYSWIVREKEVTREQLSKYVNRYVKNPNFINAIKGLKAKGFIEINPAIKKSGIPEKIVLKDLSNYARGYTLIPTLLTKLYTKKGISSNAYKLLVLLKKYSFGKSEVYPTIYDLHKLLGISEKWVSELLKWLEDEGLIKRHYKQFDNGKTKIIIQLMY